MPALIRAVVEPPPSVQVRVDGDRVEVRGEKGTLSRSFRFPDVRIHQENGRIVIEADSMRRRTKAAVGTIKAHLRNMFRGVTEGFTYKLRAVYSHFPIRVEVKGDKVLIHNLLGEKFPRVAKIVGNTKVEVNGDEIIVTGINKDDVGQTAINIEQATAIRHRDRRIFQDGCYIVERG